MLSVLFYHVHLGCPGGFVGVDVFFVISGYLITQLLTNSIGTGRFRLADFWQRRIRRLFPALLVMLVATAFTSMYLLLPEDQIRLGQLLIAQPFLAANFVIWRIIPSGYFGEPSECCPTLHTWSLAVEEQFYLFFPLILIYVLRRSPRRLTATLGILGLASFWACQASLQAHPTRIFYLLPFRAWELLLGCLAARGLSPNSRLLSEAAALTGIVLIILPVVGYSAETPFPGLAALPPCAGTALLLVANSRAQTRVGGLLSLPPLVGVGLISYSLYLWHWPIIVFRAYFTGLAPFPLAERFWLVLVSLLAAWVSWRFVERPGRYSKGLQKGNRTWQFAVAGSVLLFLLGTTILLFGGFPRHWSARALGYSNSRYSLSFAREVTPDSVQDLQYLALGDGDGHRLDFILWGDSHAMALAPAMDQLARQSGFFGVEWTRTSTAPVLDQTHPAFDGPARNQVNNVCKQLISGRGVKHVVLSAYWNFYLEREPDLDSDLVRTAQVLDQMGVNVWIAKDVPEFPCFPPLALAVNARFGRTNSGLNWSDYQASNARMEEIYGRMPPSVRFIDPTGALLDSHARIRLESEGVSLFRDAHHLSIEGAGFVRDSMRPFFESLRRSGISEQQSAKGTH